MRSKNLSNIIVCVLTLTIVISASCTRSEKGQSQVSNEMATMPEVSSDVNGALARRLDGKPDIPEPDWEAFYESVLRKHGVHDFRTDSLISLMDSEIPSVKGFGALLLGHRQEFSAIPRLEEALSDEFPTTKTLITMALLKMGNRKGIKVLEDLCARISKEFEQGNYENTLFMSDAAMVLAEAGELSAIPYLRQLLTYDRSWGTRLNAVRSLRKLYEKDPAVLTDIASMENDEHPQVRREASEILQRIDSNK